LHVSGFCVYHPDRLEDRLRVAARGIVFPKDS